MDVLKEGGLCEMSEDSERLLAGFAGGVRAYVKLNGKGTVV